ncbi:MAG: ABC transporter ATP-binding protein [Candidatus Tectomicrobia bacterium]|nr:ABC transporter ATP-binding protein [Candidatus Tectomicrobia bacterium]
MRAEVRDVTKVFWSRQRGDVTALAGVTLTVEDGEFFGIIGPNGCGKTTLLHLLAGLDQPTSGDIQFTGERRCEAVTAMVFQEHALMPWRVVERNVGFSPEIKGKPLPIYRRITDHFLRVVRMKNFDDAFPFQLSEGMRKKTSIARALAHDPEILLMDEPFANIDAQQRMLLQEELLEIWERQRKTVIYVTHSLEEAVMLCDRIAVLSVGPGRVKEVLTVRLPRPRTIAMMADPEFGRTISRLWQLLKYDVERAIREGPTEDERRREAKRGGWR